MNEIQYERYYEILQSEPPESTPKKTKAFQSFKLLATTTLVGKTRMASDIGHNAVRRIIWARRNRNTELRSTMSEIITPEKFCLDFVKEVITVDPTDRKVVALGYAKTLESMLEAARQEGRDEPKGK